MSNNANINSISALAIELADVDVKIPSKKSPVSPPITKWPSTEKSDDIGSVLSNIALRDDHRYGRLTKDKVWKNYHFFKKYFFAIKT